MKLPPAPEFWNRPGLGAQLLEPLAWAFAAAGAARRALAHPYRAPVPVLCVGNLVAGGAGKTPVVLSLARRLTAQGARPHLLSRGYGGSEAGPLAVDPARHDAAQVGDEALLLAQVAPTWIARDRAAGARAAAAAGAGIIVMDDGFQNPSLVKDRALLVVDGGYGFGNGRVMPAGPLRERVPAALARADAVVLMGADADGVAARLGGARVLRAELVAVASTVPAGRVVAFAGIGRPEKFFRTVAATGAIVVARHAFADHHRYGAAELERLGRDAEAAGARLVTTAKDAVRLPQAWRARVSVLEVEVRWQDDAALKALLAPVVAAALRHG
ncbi:MAG TPA: tetraacyldisaccharide 4'-kinase [Stellaceae bacterium]|nr:tetraacyldisaccharide 4'-kinase [Stellaceae bacterium]